MIYPDICPDEWAKKHGILREPVACANCGRPQNLDIPFAFGNKRGLMARDHKCGEEFTPMRYVSKDNSENLKLIIILDSL